MGTFRLLFVCIFYTLLVTLPFTSEKVYAEICYEPLSVDDPTAEDGTKEKSNNGKKGDNGKQGKKSDGDISTQHYCNNPTPTTPTPSKPGTPSVSTVNSTSGTYSVSWAASSDMQTSGYQAWGYDLQEYRNGTVVRNIQVPPTSTSYSVSGNPDGNYQYRVKGCNNDLNSGLRTCSSYSSTSNINYVRYKPSRPAKPADKNSTTGSYSISWSKPSGTVTHYLLQERKTGQSWPSSSINTSSTSRSFSGKANNTQWEYRVRACNQFSWACSSYSSNNIVKVRFKPSTPAKPGNINNTTGSYTVSWTKPSGTVGYYYVQERVVGGTWDDVGSVSGASATKVTTTSISVTGKANNTNWEYRVKACNNEDWACSGYSSINLVKVRFKPAKPNAPSVPAGEVKDSFDVSWTKPTGTVTFYDLIEYNNFDTGYDVAANNLNATKLTINDKVDGKYRYRVRACNDFACSSYSGYSSEVYVLQAFGNSQPASGPARYTLSQYGGVPAQNSSSDEVGAIAGEFRVNESGQATYNIPIYIPAGRAGVKPQVSIAYSSQGGPGILGLGWNLSVGSAITRCRQTDELDGNEKGVSLSYSDRFCLDGQRLILESGEYGKNGSTYRTELASQTKVIAKGTAGNGPSYFEVYRKDGSLSYYGNTADSQLRANSVNTVDGTSVNTTVLDTVLVWSQSQYIDNPYLATSNEINYEYDEQENFGEQKLKKISYSPNNEIEFVYGRNFIQGGMGVGGYQRNSKKLTQIIVRDGVNEVRKYDFGYKTKEVTIYDEIDDGVFGDPQHTYITDDYPLRLLSVTESAKSDTGNWVSRQPTTFEWQDSATGYDQATNSTAFGQKYMFVAIGGKVYDGNFQFGDVNGDGNQDLILAKKSNEQISFYVAKSKGTNSDVTGGSYVEQSCTVNIGEQKPKADDFTWGLIDFNGDGLSDLFTTDYVTTNSYAIKVFPGQSNGCFSTASIVSGITSTSHDVARPQDYNGDGLPDILINNQAYTNNWSVISMQRTGNSTAPYKWTDSRQIVFSGLDPLPGTYPEYEENFIMKKHKVSDFNGDGRVDLVASRHIVKRYTCNPAEPLTCTEFISNIEYAFTSEGNGVFKKLYALPSGVKKDDDGNRIDQFVDINGDGLADYLYKKSSDNYWYFRLSTGKKLLAAKKIIGLGTTAYPSFTDYNHDGRLDIAFNKDSKLHILPGTESGFYGTPTNTNLHLGSGNVVSTFSDVNGDGIQEHIRFEMEGSQDSIRVDKPNHPNNTHRYIIKKFENGMGNVTNVIYRPLPYSNLYTNATGSAALNWGASDNCGGGTQVKRDACSPVFDMNGPMYVVSQATSSSPTKQNPSATAGVSYKYGKARMQAKGRGFLGFEWLETTDLQTQIKTKTTYRQDYPFIGSPEKTVTTYNGTVLSEAINYWQKKLITLANGNRIRFPYLLRSAEARWSLNTGGGSSFVSETLTESIYDNFGNVTKITNVQSATRQYNHISGIPDLSTISGITKTVTVNTYNDNITKWQLGRLTQATVTHSRQGQPDVVRTSAFEYDPATGFLLKEIIEPGSSDPNKNLTTVYRYDSFGNITLKRTCSIHVSSCETSGQADDSNPYHVNRWTKTVYDTAGRYPVKTTNAFGQTTSEILARNELGQPTQIKGINGAVTHKGYGAFGHHYFTFSPDGSWSQETKFLCASNCPSVAVYGVKTVNATGGKSYVYYDALGREVQKAGIHFDGNYVVSETEYNVRGLPIRATEPEIQSSYNSSPGGLYSTTTSYDVLGRPEVINNPDGGQTYLNYYLNQTITTNPLQQTKKEYFDASGKVTRVDDTQGNSITYEYTATGELKTLKFNGQTQSAMTYDSMGRKVSMWDADKGGANGKSWTYAYNALGELVLQTDAKGQTIETFRDTMGRAIKRIDRNASGTITGDQRWTYNNSTSTSSYGIGQLIEEKDLKTGYQMIPGYDDIGRVTDTQTYIDGQLYIASTVYDKYGRVFQAFDAASSEFANAGVRNVYNQYGYLKATYDARVVPAENNHLRKVVSMDARGNVTSEIYGNGVVTTRTHYPATGRIKTILSTKGSIRVQQLEYYWDYLGNLTRREELDSVTNELIAEDFTYDSLNRLLSASHPNESMTLSYDAGGNILSKSGVGSYTYGGTCNGVTAGPHAVTNAGGKSYCYDSNGNMLSGDGRTMVYSTFDKLTKVTKGAHTTEFEYAPSRSRYKRVDNDNEGVITTTHYAGNVEVIKKSNKSYTIYRRNLGGVLLEERTNGSKRIHYLHTDHLGSTDVITDFAGDVKQQFSFNAFGEQRSAIDWKTYLNSPEIYLSPASNALTSRGFTGHEQMDEVGLIHMNGRVYDPKLGRFIQADPHIQSPSDTQSLNRYSYVKNNPLSYTDPTGYFFKKLWDEIRPFVAVIVGVILTIYCGPCSQSVWGAMGAGAVSGAAGAAANGGNVVDGAVFGAFSGAAFYGVGQAFGHQTLSPESVIAHGAVGGVMSELQGGKFGHGFASAGFTKGFSKQIGSFETIGGRTIAAAVVGGTSSKLGGGKFSNGAITGAFSRLFNDEAGPVRERKKLEQAYAETEVTYTELKISSSSKYDARVIAAEYESLGMEYDIWAEEWVMSDPSIIIDIGAAWGSRTSMNLVNGDIATGPMFGSKKGSLWGYASESGRLGAELSVEILGKMNQTNVNTNVSFNAGFKPIGILERMAMFPEAVYRYLLDESGATHTERAGK
ncbi:FG-GAP-like repeat-containing protein [Kangiella sp.]|uniref:FG-GAP-like repeat-containing protein n=1 Tax=Kangiella sp. TaxID=1920245 RepID=UPI003A8D1B80